VSDNKFSLFCLTFTGTLNQLYFTLLFIFTSFHTISYFSFFTSLFSMELVCLLTWSAWRPGKVLVSCRTRPYWLCVLHQSAFRNLASLQRRTSSGKQSETLHNSRWNSDQLRDNRNSFKQAWSRCLDRSAVHSNKRTENFQFKTKVRDFSDIYVEAKIKLGLNS
jgi:hypothetical protein